MKARLILAALPLLALFASGCGEAPEAAAAATAVTAPPPIPVVARTRAELAIELERAAPAQVLARNEAALAAEVPGVVTRVHADVGERVETGAALVSLDARDYRLALAQAEAQLAAAIARVELAQARRKRAQDLAARKFMSPDEWAEVDTAVRVAEAERQVAATARDQAARNLDKSTLHAPYAAVVRARHAQVGQMAAAGTLLVELVELDASEVAAQLAVADAESLATASVPRFVTQGGSHSLRLVRLSPVLARGARTREARLEFTGAPAPIGAEGRVEWTEHAAALPPDLLVRRDDQLGVFLAETGTARFFALPEAEEGRAFVAELPPETLIVSQGQQRLADGAAIEVRR
jgi:RND family efflux transporter MFP subunit